MGALPGRGGLIHLPPLAARDLTGATRPLPAELPADPTAVVHAFVGFLVPEAEGHALEEIQEAFVARANRNG